MESCLDCFKELIKEKSDKVGGAATPGRRVARNLLWGRGGCSDTEKNIKRS